MRPESVARRITDAVVRRPWLWRLFRWRTQALFDALAPSWETRLGPHHLLALEQAVAGLEPKAVLDVGTGTGKAAIALAAWFPQADVVGVDLSAAMVDEARKHVTERPRFEVADASRLPFPDGSFDLVVLMNAIPFFDELARVTALGGGVVNSYSRGDETPIYVSDERLQRELGRRGFTDFASFTVPPTTAYRARKR
ncbi:MAG: class I SAM-dependent methyltransferase [Actinobacteria bacterium]|nr:class I SAM-dependent methyltransferase [Actinomycetota bacterium]